MRKSANMTPLSGPLSGIKKKPSKSLVVILSLPGHTTPLASVIYPFLDNLCQESEQLVGKQGHHPKHQVHFNF